MPEGVVDVEGAGAAALAALLAYPERFRGKKCGLILCGGKFLPTSEYNGSFDYTFMSTATAGTGATVAIMGGVAAADLMREIGRAVLRNGGHPIYLPTLPEIQSDLLELGSDEQIEFISPIEQFARTEANVAITIMAATNTSINEKARRAITAVASPGR